MLYMRGTLRSYQDSDEVYSGASDFYTAALMKYR